MIGPSQMAMVSLSDLARKGQILEAILLSFYPLSLF